MSYKKYKKKDLVNIINDLSEEINDLHLELKNKDEQLLKLLEEKEDEEEIEILDKEIKDKNLKRLINYLEKQIKTTYGEKKELYKSYLFECQKKIN